LDKDQLNIIKIGGQIIDNEPQLDKFLSDFAQMSGKKILVHGGGRTADHLLEIMGIQPAYHEGRRITDHETMKAVAMSYAGLTNTSIVARLQGKNSNAIGFSGADGNAIRAVKRPVKNVDYGLAGDIVEINNQLILGILDEGLVPVFCAVTHDKAGNLLNTNADTIASELASALADKYLVNLLFCFEKKGVLKDQYNTDDYFSTISHEMYLNELGEKVLSGGILPKLHNAFYALKNGVSEVWIMEFGTLNVANRNGTRIIL